MKKIFVCAVLSLSMLLSTAPSIFALEPMSADQEHIADGLNYLGLFGGVGKNDQGCPIYELDRTPSRNEAITMLVRLLGKGQDAKAGTWTTPFTDVVGWAEPYVGYAYEHGLAGGTSASTYSGAAPAGVSQYLTFVLRALGYSSSTDFAWDQAWVLSDQIGLTNGEYNETTKNFTRGDVVDISYQALQTKQKNSEQTLADQLISEDVFSRESYELVLADMAAGKDGEKLPHWNGEAKQFPGTGTRNKPYRIESAEHLAYLAEQVNSGLNNYQDKYFELTCDLNLAGLEWAPVGIDFQHSFAGKFDGNNHKIYQMRITKVKPVYMDSYLEDYCFVGLFGCTTSGSIIKNLSVDGDVALVIDQDHSEISAAAGGIVGFSQGTVDNCHNFSRVSVYSSSLDGLVHVGGVCGFGRSMNIQSCSNAGAVYGYSVYSTLVGGICGNNQGVCHISDCLNFGSVCGEGSSYVGAGGIIDLNSDDIITNCGNMGNVNSTKAAGGVAAYLTKGYGGNTTAVLKNCLSVGAITGETAGGVAGDVSGGSIENCGWLKPVMEYALVAIPETGITPQ